MEKELTLKLRVQEDAELRNYLKELLRTQIQSLIRENIREIVQAETEKIEKLTQQEIIITMRKELDNAVKQYTGRARIGNFVGNSIVESWMREMVKQHIDMELKDIDLSAMVRKALSNRKIQVEL